jgi:hypothetical protein
MCLFGNKSFFNAEVRRGLRRGTQRFLREEERRGKERKGEEREKSIIFVF